MKRQEAGLFFRLRVVPCSPAPPNKATQTDGRFAAAADREGVRRTEDMTSADQVWNRAALESGGSSPGPGDRALASLLRVHGLVMNGGVHHAIECIKPADLAAAADGYAFFGLEAVAEFFRGASADPVLSICDDDTEAVANGRYSEMVTDDSSLVARFEQVFRERPEQFAPIGPS